MPINPELKHLYPPNWREISRRIRFERASGKCERCAALHGKWKRSDSDFFYDSLDEAALAAVNIHEDEAKITRIILTTAHLDHNPENNDEDNLAALCQRCHLAHDQHHHLQSRRRNQEKRSGQGRLFERD